MSCMAANRNCACIRRWHSASEDGAFSTSWELNLKSNEGHAALAVFERARDFMASRGHSFEIALTATRSGNVFTTHTPAEAGFDRFPPDMIGHYLTSYADQLGISLENILALGRKNSMDENEPFNMAYLAG